MIPRILEPEVMDSAEEARDYDSMDHREVNERFAADFLQAAAGLKPAARVLDVGTGTALIPIEIASRSPDMRITAIDLAEEMLNLGRRNVARAGCDDRIDLRRVDAKDLAGEDAAFDAVVSNSIIHHIPEPLAVFREMKRVCREGGLLFVRDLLRPESTERLEELVALHAAGTNGHQRKLFSDSLHAALTLNEVADLLDKTGLPRGAVEQTSDRHWT
ncbi:MAG TPA: class I SAM-dependent methyltransferase, partial [Caulifigura sp.]|nr:class I SAM-dependent methyltransferase [Caulifigura sp.]